LILGDYHTHTVFSHGKSTIEANVKAVRERGLKEIAITDHGLRHMAFGMKNRDIPKMRSIIDNLNQEYSDIKVLFGVEANIYCKEGYIDLNDRQTENLDVVLAGFHKGVWPKSPAQFFSYFGRAYKFKLFSPRQHEIDFYTKAYIRAIEHGKIDVLTHLTYGVPVDVLEVGKAARDYGVLIELNGKRITMSDEQIMGLDNAGVNFIINSDAHFASKVGDLSAPLAVAERLNLNKDRIANWNKLPTFRSKK